MASALLWLVYIGLLVLQPSPMRHRRFGIWLLGGSLLVALFFWQVLHDPRTALFGLCAAVAAATAWYTDASTLRQMARIHEEREKLARLSSDLVVRDDQIRIARELHDGIGANLVALVWRTQRLQRDAVPEMRREMQALTDRAGASLDELRGAVWALHNPNRPWPELVDWVRSRLAEPTLESSSANVIDITADEGAGERPVRAEVGRALLRALQSVVSSCSTPLAQVTIALDLRNEGVRAIIEREPAWGHGGALDDAVVDAARRQVAAEGGIATLNPAENCLLLEIPLVSSA